VNESHKRHYPSEIFGYTLDDKSKDAINSRKKYMCPFVGNAKCSKLSRLLNYPMGVCSTWWPNNSPLAICPKRFLQDKTIFIDVANHVFGSINNVLLFPEVKLKNIGTFDFVLVKHKPISSEIDDFCVVEFQTCSTTGTGKLVKAIDDFMNGQDIKNNSYAFGMNTYNDIKLSFIQMLNKGQVFEVWNKKIVWALQKYIYDNMINRFYLQNMQFNERDANIFFVYDIDYSSSELYKLYKVGMQSSTIENLMEAFRNAELPKIDDFIKVLYKKLKLNLGVSL
jgi:hypothetical protein